MKVYIIYDRYEHDEWFKVYHVCKTKSEVKYVYKQDLFNFFSSGPDDCHSFQCVIVEDISKEEYELLKKSENDKSLTDDEEDEFNELMVRINDCMCDSNCLFSTDNYGNIEVFEEYMSEYYPDVDKDSDEWYDAEEEFYNEDNLYETGLKKYIDRNYKI